MNRIVTPNARVTFPERDYRQALADYLAMKAWCESTGVCFHDGITGLLKSPQFRGKDSPSPIPNEWLDEPHWQFVMYLHIDGPFVLVWLKRRIAERPLPKDAEFKFEPEKEMTG
jgi:hypothetical protein